tara:strand:+ start:834 stop:1964 length:1131 start_codon:yes stop_codon:yes gene_type:complete
MNKLENELEGITVVSLEQAVAAPYCGVLLANSGARVIKVERKEGDFARGYDDGAEGQSTIFAWLNRGKESICLNLKDEKDLSVLINIIKKSDVLLSNLAPGALGRISLTNSFLKKINPKLINCKITGYGEEGDAAKKKAYDFLVQAESGLCSVTGSEESPSRVGVSITDISTGLTAFSAILRALIKRSNSNTGSEISISMFDVIADWMNMPLLAHRYSGQAPKRMGLKHSFIAPYGAYECSGGKKILLSIQSNREFEQFCNKVLEKPELAKEKKFLNNPERFKNRVELDNIINDFFKNFDVSKIIELLDLANIANANLNSVADLSEHPFLKNSKARIGNKFISMASLPVETGLTDNINVPDIGEHTDKIRKEFSFS